MIIFDYTGGKFIELKIKAKDYGYFLAQKGIYYIYLTISLTYLYTYFLSIHATNQFRLYVFD